MLRSIKSAVIKPQWQLESQLSKPPPPRDELTVSTGHSNCPWFNLPLYLNKTPNLDDWWIAILRHDLLWPPLWANKYRKKEMFCFSSLTPMNVIMATSTKWFLHCVRGSCCLEKGSVHPVPSACCCRVCHHQVWRTLPQRANSSPAESLLYFQQLERERNEFQLHSSCFEGSPDKTWQCDQIVPLFSAARVGCLQTSGLYSVF